MRIEIIVFGVIGVFVVALSLINLIPTKTANLPDMGKAPELAGIRGWINSEPLTLESLKGNVVLIDFWTYTCINCIRTLPYVNEWHSRYSDKGLVIIGVHTPEFEFEKDYNNVRAAVEKYGIKYAVAQDNDYATWRAYRNNFWPRKYLVDANGDIRYDHIGEGGYAETEQAIQSLLEEAGFSGGGEVTNHTTEVDFRQIGTPELYLGYQFSRTPLGNSEGFSPEAAVDYKLMEVTKTNTIYLAGKWENKHDRMISVEDSKLFLIYRAKEVNIVAGGSAEIAVLLDGQPVTESTKGNDVLIGNNESIVKIDSQRLYNIVSTPGYESHLLEIGAQPGFGLYTFTFG